MRQHRCVTSGFLDAVREVVAKQVGDEDEEDMNKANVMQNDDADSEENTYAKKMACFARSQI